MNSTTRKVPRLNSDPGGYDKDCDNFSKVSHKYSR